MSWAQRNTHLRCGNCNKIIDNEQSTNTIKFVNIGDLVQDEIQIIDAISYVYGVSWEEFRTWSAEQLRGANLDGNFIGHWLNESSLKLCDVCALVLSDNYKAHTRFEQLSHDSSFIYQINKFRQGQSESMSVPNIKPEPVVGDVSFDNQENVDVNSFCEFNFDSEEVPESALETKYDPVGNEEHKNLSKTKTLKKKRKIHKTKAGSFTSVRKSLRSGQVSLNHDLPSKDVVTSHEKNVAIKTTGSSKQKFAKNSKAKESFECQLCHKTFERKGKLTQHLRNAHYRKLLRENCKLCGKNVQTCELSRHMKAVHSTEEEKLKEKVPCQICGKLVGKKSLKSHMHCMHSGEVETFKCETCGKTFVQKQNYDAHILTHSEGFTPFLCVQCGKKFNCKSTLAIHEKTHTGIKFTCEICSKQFPLISYLNKHLKKFHVTERKYVCDECGKHYKNKDYFVLHQRLHKEMAEKGENSVQCDECGKNFKHSHTLNRHKLRNHREDLKKVYQCNLCSKILSDADCLRTHKKLVHKIFTKMTVSNQNNNSAPENSQTQISLK